MSKRLQFNARREVEEKSGFSKLVWFHGRNSDSAKTRLPPKSKNLLGDILLNFY